MCNVVYPNDRDKFKICPACGDECWYSSSETVTEDWQEQITENVKRWEGGAQDTVPLEWYPTSQTPEGESDPQEGS